MTIAGSPARLARRDTTQQSNEREDTIFSLNATIFLQGTRKHEPRTYSSQSECISFRSTLTGG